MYKRYSTIKRDFDDTGRVYLTNPIYPEIEETENDIYILSSDGDRYDILAKNFYGDPSFWWIIATANNSTRDNLTITPGEQIRIPANKERIISRFEDLNRNR